MTSISRKTKTLVEFQRRDLPNPSDDISEIQESQLWGRLRKGEEFLREFFILKYSPLVKYVAGRVIFNVSDRVEFEDLVGFGTFGLIDAISRFDPEKGIKFKTYAITRIRGQIYDELRSLDWVPRSVRKKYKIIEEEKKRYAERHNNEEISVSKLSEITGIVVSEIERISGLANDSNVGSLDDVWIIRGNEEEVAIIDTVQSPDSINPHAAVERSEVRRIIAEQIQILPEREKQVLVLYYYEDLTLKEIGAVLDVTESRVSQLHNKAIRNIRAALDSIKKSLV